MTTLSLSKSEYAQLVGGKITDTTKKVQKPDKTNAQKLLQKLERERLQETFRGLWLQCGGSAEFWQAEVMFDPDRRWRFDFANDDLKIAVEINGGQHGGGREVPKGYQRKTAHNSPEGLQRDAEKGNSAQYLGWNVIVFTTSMLDDATHVDRLLKFAKERYERYCKAVS